MKPYKPGGGSGVVVVAAAAAVTVSVVACFPRLCFKEPFYWKRGPSSSSFEAAISR